MESTCTVDIFGISSSGFGDSRPPLTLRFVSDFIWLCRRVRGGVGGSFLLIEEDGDGGSGILPIASLSKGESRSES